MVLGPVFQQFISMANFSAIANDADFYAESTGEGPTFQINDMLEKFYCLQQVHLAENLLQAKHTQIREKTT